MEQPERVSADGKRTLPDILPGDALYFNPGTVRDEKRKVTKKPDGSVVITQPFTVLPDKAAPTTISHSFTPRGGKLCCDECVAIVTPDEAVEHRCPQPVTVDAKGAVKS